MQQNFLKQKTLQSCLIAVVLNVILWSMLCHLVDSKTFWNYFLVGLVVCAFNTIIQNLMKGRGKAKSVLTVSFNWVAMAGTVLVLYHLGFMHAAVFLAVMITLLSFFYGWICEGIVGVSLLITLAVLIR